MSIKKFLPSKSHAIILGDKSRCREVECREGTLAQVSSRGRPPWLTRGKRALVSR